MIHFPFVNLPDYFSRLLKMNVNRDAAYESLLEEFRINHSLKSLVEGIVRDKDNRGNSEKIFKTKGWGSIREKLASIYITKAKTGKWPHKVDLSSAGGIFDFEDKLKHYTVEGISRGFLIGLYLEIGKANQEREHTSKRNGRYFEIPDEVFELLGMFKVKVVNIDWLLLWLSYFHEYIGDERLKEHVKKMTPFEEILNELSNDQREHTFQNMLSYGASINETSIFVEDEV